MCSSKKRFRWIMLAMLCAGLLTVGIGAGVAFAEYSTFTYAGQRVPGQAQTQSQSFTAAVDPEAKRITISGYDGSGFHRLSEMAKIEVSKDLEPGTVRFDLRYQSIGRKIRADWNESPQENTIWLYWTGESDMDILMAYKDQILEDIRSRQLGDYTAILLEEVVITVNPVDAGKILLD